jgi:hypothetical protein
MLVYCNSLDPTHVPMSGTLQGRRQEILIRGAKAQISAIGGAKAQKNLSVRLKKQGHISKYWILGGARAPAGPPLSPPLVLYPLTHILSLVSLFDYYCV